MAFGVGLGGGGRKASWYLLWCSLPKSGHEWYFSVTIAFPKDLLMSHFHFCTHALVWPSARSYRHSCPSRDALPALHLTLPPLQSVYRSLSFLRPCTNIGVVLQDRSRKLAPDTRVASTACWLINATFQIHLHGGTHCSRHGHDGAHKTSQRRE